MRSVLFFGVIVLLFSPFVSAEPSANYKKVEMYCNIIVKPLTILSLKERSKGTKKIKLVSTLKSMREFSSNKQVKSDIEEIASFVYNEGRTATDERVIDFLVNDWCLGQAHTFVYN